MPQFYTEDEAIQAVKKLISCKLFLSASTTIEENLAVFPDSKQLQFMASHIALETNDFFSAIKILEKLNTLDPNQIQVLVPLARAWNLYGELDKALGYLAEAESAEADPMMMTVLRAEVYERSGQLDLLDEQISLLPDKAKTLNIRARSHIARKNYDSAIDLLESDYESRSIEANELVANHFTLAKALDRVGEYDRAWAAAQTAHSIEEVKFDLASHLSQFDQMKEFMTEELVGALAEGPFTEMEPFFIVGNPRSGTSLLEQILSMHPDIANGGEMSVGHTMQLRVSQLTDSFHAWPMNMIDIRKDDAAALSEHYLSANEGIGTQPKIISNKALNLTQQLGFLSKILPSSRAVMLYRHPLDNAVSCYTTNLLVSGHFYEYIRESG